MSIVFDEVPTTRIPGVYVELNTKAAARGLPTTPVKVAFIGQMTSAGTANADEVVTIIDADDARTKFGKGSMLARMIEAALDADNRVGEILAVPVDDAGAGTAASATFAITASSQAAGTLTVWVGDEPVSVAVSAADTQNGIAAALKAAFDLLLDLPVTATVSTNTVTVTCKHKGTLGNQLDQAWEYSTTGVSVVASGFSSGATDPSIDDALDALFPVAADVIVFPYNDATNLDALVEHLDARSDGVEQRPAVAVAAKDDTVSNMATLGSGRNSGRLLLATLRGTRTWAPELAAAYAAVLAGESDLARPLNTLALGGVHAPVSSSRYTRAELTTLLANGVAPVVVGPTEDPQVLRSITTYVLNAVGVPSTTLLDIQTIRTLDYVRAAIWTRLTERFARMKIADVAHSETTTDPDKIRAEVISVLKDLEAIDYIEAVDDNLDAVLVERNASDPSRVDIALPSDVVNGLHVTAIRIDLVL